MEEVEDKVFIFDNILGYQGSMSKILLLQETIDMRHAVLTNVAPTAIIDPWYERSRGFAFV